MAGPGRAEQEAATRPPPVAVGRLRGQHRPQIPLPEDQHQAGDPGPRDEHQPFGTSARPQLLGGIFTETSLRESVLSDQHPLEHAALDGADRNAKPVGNLLDAVRLRRQVDLIYPRYCLGDARLRTSIATLWAMTMRKVLKLALLASRRLPAVTPSPKSPAPSRRPGCCFREACTRRQRVACCIA
jgi:hypothetical protein